MMLRFACNIQTASFLGTKGAALDFLKILRGLPAAFTPTKIRAPHFPPQNFNLKAPKVFLENMPGKFFHEGAVTLTRPKGIFEFSVQWQKGDHAWFAEHPTKPFNWVGFSSGLWEEIISERYFSIFKNLFVSVCETFQTIYGSMSLDDSSVMPPPNGRGLCLPRLYWITYLGKPYCQAMESQLAKPCDSFTVSHLAKGALIQLAGSAQDTIKQSASETQAIQHLGPDYFWNPKDNWRKPQFRYRMPEIDWSGIITNFKI
jgi:hypothetical protein